MATAFGVKACIVTAAGPDANLTAFEGHELHVVSTEDTLTFEHSYTWWGELRTRSPLEQCFPAIPTYPTVLDRQSTTAKSHSTAKCGSLYERQRTQQAKCLDALQPVLLNQLTSLALMQAITES